VAADMLDGGAPDLSNPQHQAELQRLIDLLDPDVLICDNIATLVRSEQSESDDQSWVEAQAWSLRMRRQGRAVIWIHHSNKSGSQRGTSKREDVLNIVINLRRPSDYKPEQGARFEVHFEKARGIFGGNVESFEAWLEPDEAGGRSHWHVNGLSSLRDRILELDAEGVLHADIARQLGVNKSTVSKYVGKRAKAATAKPSRRAKPQRST